MGIILPLHKPERKTSGIDRDVTYYLGQVVTKRAALGKDRSWGFRHTKESDRRMVGN